MTRTRRGVAGLLLAVALCVGVFLHFFGYTKERLVPASTYTVDAVLPDAGGLAVNSDVRSAGLTIGRVQDVAVRGGSAVVRLEIDHRYAPVYRNATVLVRDKTPVGEHYLQLNLGSPSSGAITSGGVLPRGDTREYVSIDEMLSTFSPWTRRRLRLLLRGLGGGLGGHGRDLNRLFETSAALVQDGAPALDVLNAEHERVAGMVDDLGRVMAALGERADAIRLLSRRAKAASEAIASRDVALGQALEELPTTVTQVDSTTGRLARFSRSATPVLRNMGQGFRQLAPAVRTLQPAAAAGRRTMAALDRFATRATPLTGDLRGFATRAVDLPPALKRFLNEYRPFVAYLAPYAGDVGSFFALNRLASELVSGPGKVLRVLFTISEDSYGATRGEERRALDALIETGLVTKVHTVGVNPYPAPGTVGHPRPFDGHYPRVKVDR